MSTFGKIRDSDDYVFFAVDSQDEHYECKGNVVNTQSYVSNYALHDYPIAESDILSRGRDAWNAALNTVRASKQLLGRAGKFEVRWGAWVLSFFPVGNWILIFGFWICFH